MFENPVAFFFILKEEYFELVYSSDCTNDNQPGGGQVENV